MTQEQITELQTAYKEFMEEVCSLGVWRWNTAVHDRTREVALFFDDGEVKAIHVLKHFKESDCCEIFHFIMAGGCAVRDEVLISQPDEGKCWGPGCGNRTP
jgi:hypothetical protein